MSSPQSIAGRWVFGVLAALFFALWFGTLETRGLFWPDEGRYAEVAREMVASGDYVTPRLNDLKYFEKPPLQYWASAVAFRIFGPDEWSARLWPATTGFLLVLVSAALWWRWRGPAVGVLAGSMLASAWGIVFGAQILSLDMGLALFLSLALLAFVGAHRPGLDPRARAWAMTLVWAMMAFAVLSKGLVGIVLPGLALGVYAAVERDAAVLRSAFTLRGIAVFLAITLPWFILVQRANPEFFDLFFVREHFQRYLQPSAHRPGAWWYFLPLVAAFLLPWTGALPGALRDAWNAPRQGSLRVERLLLIWALVVIAFFSVSSSKLPLYILPALPAIVWLIALSSPARHPRIALGGAITSGIAGVAMVAFSTQLGAMEKLREVGPGLLEYPPFLAAAGGTLLAAGALMGALHHRVERNDPDRRPRRRQRRRPADPARRGACVRCVLFGRTRHRHVRRRKAVVSAGASLLQRRDAGPERVLLPRTPGDGRRAKGRTRRRHRRRARQVHRGVERVRGAVARAGRSLRGDVPGDVSRIRGRRASDDGHGHRSATGLRRTRALAAGNESNREAGTLIGHSPAETALRQCSRCRDLRAFSDTVPRRGPLPRTLLALRRSCQKR